MSDEKPKPVDDLKQGLGLLFRAAKGAVDSIHTDKIEGAVKEGFRAARGAVESLPTDKIEGAVKEGAKEVGKAFETVAHELDKAISNVTHRTPSSPPDAHGHAGPAPKTAEPPTATSSDAGADAKKQDSPAAHFDDAYAPEPKDPGKGPRVG